MIPLFSTIIFLLLLYIIYKKNVLSPGISIILMFFIITVLYMVYMHGRIKYNPNHVKEGKEYAKNTSIIMATCLRDAEQSIESIELLYNKFNNIFKQVKLIILENNSTDQTRKKLLEIKKNKIPSMDIIGCGIDQDSCSLKLNNVRTGWSSARTRRMAKIRNILLNHIKLTQKDYDFCLMFDGDLKIEEFENEGIYDTMYHFKNDKSIDAIASNTYQDHGEVYNRIYDPYAFKPIKGTRLNSLLYYFKEKGLIKVKSAFNGFVFYRLPFSEEIQYNENTDTCEHIEFNEQLQNMYINKNFVIEITGH